jgi:hypothetical protein
MFQLSQRKDYTMPGQHSLTRQGRSLFPLFIIIAVLLFVVLRIGINWADPVLGRHLDPYLSSALALLLSAIITCLPLIVAFNRQHPHFSPILIANLALLLGGLALISMTVYLVAPLVVGPLGALWVGLLVWSAWPLPVRSSRAQEQ